MVSLPSLPDLFNRSLHDLLPLFRNREQDCEGGTTSGRTGYHNRATMLLQYSINNRKSQPGPLANILGRIERLEDMRKILGVNAMPVSRTVITAQSFSAGIPGRSGTTRMSRAVETVSTPPVGMASRALVIRFSKTC